MTRPWRALLETSVLPWWERHGADDATGGVHTCLRDDGSRLTDDKYTWSQGRWAWLCAELGAECDAGRLTGDAGRWHERACRTAAFVEEHAVAGGARTHFVTGTRGGRPADGDPGTGTSVLADLFAALGLAGAAGSRAATVAQAHRWAAGALELLESAERRIDARTAPSAPYPVPAGFTDSASRMLLLNVGSELGRLTGSVPAAGVAERARRTLTGGMWRRDGWWELRPDTPADTDTLAARHVTPGHLLEAMWMVADAHRHGQTTAGPPEWTPDLALRCLTLAWDPERGGLFRYVDSRDGGAPRGRLRGGDPYEDLVRRTWDTKLWWVHVEALYATRLLAEEFGSAELAAWHERIADYTLATFPDHHGGEWTQIRDRSGRPLDEVVALPVKDPFHIPRALLLLHRLDTGVTAGTTTRTTPGDTTRATPGNTARTTAGNTTRTTAGNTARATPENTTGVTPASTTERGNR
ncbi:AGE family epimerase/isomerase [Pseudonocardia sp. HH130630-07]|uniref:AGE family epimerase/isomerase n=1 Tax=Pseudonocardia sp. HH130630-07 TaxID=1690815 RepID=UPI000814F7AE|nr:AGE family epimerase/isomerase [Pseudonocardia sp. HH130630-07]ANY07121.1 hypothetical protein AFB00_13425 [Pseudonocardia sp. HH130630-07]